MLECESERKSMSVAAGVWWRDVLGGMIRGLGGYCSGGASREASSCGGKGLCLFASVRSVIEYTPLKVIPWHWGARAARVRVDLVDVLVGRAHAAGWAMGKMIFMQVVAFGHWT